MRVRQRFALAIGMCIAGSFAANFAEAQESELKTSAVAAFKNGLAFVVKEGDVHLEAGVGTLEPLPNATLGSPWIAPNDPGASLDQLVARRYRVLTRQNLTALAEVLLANVGKVVTVVDNGRKEYTGEIVGFRQLDKTKKPGESSGSSSNSNAQEIPPSISPVVPLTHVPPEFLLLKFDATPTQYKIVLLISREDADPGDPIHKNYKTAAWPNNPVSPESSACSFGGKIKAAQQPATGGNPRDCHIAIRRLNDPCASSWHYGAGI